MKEDLNKQEDLKQSGLLKTNPTHKPSSKNTGPTHQSTETSKKLTLPKSNNQTSSQEDSPAKTLATQDKEKESKEKGQDYGKNFYEPLAKYDQNTHLWKTFQHSLTGGCLPFSETLPRSGMMQNGIVYLLQPLARLTEGTESTSWPTVTTTDVYTDKLKSTQHKLGSLHSVTLAQKVLWRTPSATELMRGIGKKTIAEKKANNIQISLAAQVQEAEMREKFPTVISTDGSKCPTGSLARKVQFEEKYSPNDKRKWPTVTARSYQGASKIALKNGNPKKRLAEEVILFPTPCTSTTGSNARKSYEKRTGKKLGQLTPEFCEWLMGFPTGYTELNASETQSYHNARNSLQKLSKKRKDSK